MPVTWHKCRAKISLPPDNDVPGAKDLVELAEQVGAELKRHHAMLATAESCTGGWVAQVITSIAGSSEWFERGFVTYSNQAKQEMLKVSPLTLETFGAVSEETVREMALGALRNSHATVSLAVSGIAGPGGATQDKPVGTVCLAWADQNRATQSRTFYFSGDREAVRRQAVSATLQGLLDFLNA